MPFAFLMSDGTRKTRKWWLGCWLWVIVTGLIQLPFQPHSTAAAPGGTNNLALAGDPVRAATILLSWIHVAPKGGWPKVALQGAQIQVVLDFFFIVAYGVLLWNAAAWSKRIFEGQVRQHFDALAGGEAWPDSVAKEFRQRNNGIRFVYSLVRIAVIGACLLDAGENVCLLVLLYQIGGTYADMVARAHGWSEACAFCSTWKWAFVAAAAGWGIAGVLAQSESLRKVAYRLRYSFVLSLILLGYSVFGTQYADTLRATVENLADLSLKGVFQSMGLVVSVFLFGFFSWRWAVYTRGQTRDDGDSERARAEKDGLPGVWLPRLAFVTPFLIVALSLTGLLFGRGIEDPGELVWARILWVVFALLPCWFLFAWGCGDINGSLDDWKTSSGRRGDLTGRLTGFILWMRDRNVAFRQGLARCVAGLHVRFGKVDAAGVVAADWMVFTLNLVLGVAFFLWFVFGGKVPWLFSGYLGPTTVLFAGLSLGLPFGNGMVVAGKKTGLPLIGFAAVFVVALTLFDVNDNHAVRRHEAVLPPLLANEALPTRDPAAPSALEKHFAAWLENRLGDTPGDDKTPYPVVFFAAEGGGIRASYEAAMTMAVLQDRYPHFRQHLFFVSGVSGGSMGAAVFSGLLHQFPAGPPEYKKYLDGDVAQLLPVGALPPEKSPTPDPDKPARPHPWARAVDRILQRDLLSAPLAGSASPEMVQRFLPVVFSNHGNPTLDRALGLEYSLEDALAAGIRDITEGKTQLQDWKPNPGESAANPINFLTLPLATLAADPGYKELPVMYFNTCDQYGDRIVVSWVQPPVQSGLISLHSLTSGPTRAHQFRDFPVSTAACLSARFPVITPGGVLTSERVLPGIRRGDPGAVSLDKLRCEDGGTFENSGLSTLNAVIEALRDSAYGPLCKYRDRWYPIIINTAFSDTDLNGSRGRADTGPGMAFDASPAALDFQVNQVRAANAKARTFDRFGTNESGERMFPAVTRPDGFLDAAFTPVIAYLRTGFGGHANASQLRLLNATERWAGEYPAGSPARSKVSWLTFQFLEFRRLDDDEPTGLLPLGWSLSHQARAEMVRQTLLILDKQTVVRTAGSTGVNVTGPRRAVSPGASPRGSSRPEIYDHFLESAFVAGP